MVKNGVGYVTEDRKGEGIIKDMNLRENMSLPSLEIFEKLFTINKSKEKKISNQYIDKFEVKTPSSERLITLLSGGNQQKILLSRWLIRNLKIIILDEPTRGVDIGAKTEILRLINDLAKEGLSVILMTSEMNDLLTLSDRIIVMAGGKISKEFDRNKVTQEEILKHQYSNMNNIQKYLGKRRNCTWNYIFNCFYIFFICIRIFFYFEKYNECIWSTFYNINSFYRFCSFINCRRSRYIYWFIFGFVAIPLIQIMNFTESVALGIVVCLLVGAAIGIINGFLTVYLGISSLIVTLGNAFLYLEVLFIYILVKDQYQMNSIQIFSFILGMVNYLELFRMQLL